MPFLFLLVSLFLLCCCTAWSEKLSGPTKSQAVALHYPTQLVPIQIGRTTQQEVRQLFGNPIDIQVSSEGEVPNETWAYAKAQPPTNPAQFIPLAGYYALSDQNAAPSFSVSFSDDGMVQGLTLWDLHTYGGYPSRLYSKEDMLEEPLYGMNNPMIRQSPPSDIE